jgi:hypothetical protein
MPGGAVHTITNGRQAQKSSNTGNVHLPAIAPSELVTASTPLAIPMGLALFCLGICAAVACNPRCALYHLQRQMGVSLLRRLGHMRRLPLMPRGVGIYIHASGGVGIYDHGMRVDMYYCRHRHLSRE